MIMCRALSYEENTLDKSRLTSLFLQLIPPAMYYLRTVLIWVRFVDIQKSFAILNVWI